MRKQASAGRASPVHFDGNVGDTSPQIFDPNSQPRRGIRGQNDHPPCRVHALPVPQRRPQRPVLHVRTQAAPDPHAGRSFPIHLKRHECNLSCNTRSRGLESMWRQWASPSHHAAGCHCTGVLAVCLCVCVCVCVCQTSCFQSVVCVCVCVYVQLVASNLLMGWAPERRTACVWQPMV